MDARRQTLLRSATRLAVLLALALSSATAWAASSRTENFLVTAPTPALAEEIAQAAERFRSELAVEWLGAELPPWEQPCPISVQVGPQLGAGGATSFSFHRGRPLGWTMSIQGSRERILDSVLPHEITHTIFATHFGQPLPRWADEGACTTVEHASERQKQERLLYEFLTTERGIAFNQMFAMREYPADILPLYSQGYSLARFLIAQGGKRKFVVYVGDGLKTGDWPGATGRHYGYRDLSDLQVKWLAWVRQGMPRLDTQLAASEVSPAVASELEAGAGAVPASAAVSLAAHEPKQAPAELSQGSRALAPIPLPPVPAGLANGVPATQVAAAQLSPADYQRQGGWYARQRDAARPILASGARPLPPLAVSAAATAAQPNSWQAAARPQPLTQPQQTILQWSQGPAPVPNWRATPLPDTPPSVSQLPGSTLRR